MPDHPKQTTSKATIVAAEPELFVANIAAVLEFFTQKLGFAVAFSHGEPPFMRKSSGMARGPVVGTPLVAPRQGSPDLPADAQI